MKNLCTIFVILIALASINYAQERIILNWSVKDLIVTNNPYKKITAYEINNGENRPSNPEVPFYSGLISVNNFGVVKLRVVPIKTSSIKITHTENDQIQSDFYADGKINVRGTDFEMVYYVMPVRKTANGFEKLEEFEIYYEVVPKTISLNRGPTPTMKSVLSEGEIYKIAISKSGVYKLDKALFDKLSIPLNTINTQTIKLYSRQGGMLPELISETVEDDLIEIPLLIEGAEDGKFDANDVIYCYLEGADEWKFNKNANEFLFQKNIYDTKNYAFIKLNGEPGKRVLESSINSAATYTTDLYFDHQVFEEDKINLLGLNPGTEGSGKLWLGNGMSANEEKSLDQFFDLNDANSAENSKVTLKYYSRANQGTTVKLTVNSQNFSKNMSAVNLGEIETTHATSAVISESINISTIFPIKINYIALSSDATGYIDQLSFKLAKKIRYRGKLITITNNEFSKNNISEITGNFANSIAWDITDLSTIERLNIDGNSLKFKSGKLGQKIILFDKSIALEAQSLGKIANQNYHSISDVDMVVVYPEIFKEAAQKFTTHRSAHSDLKIEMVECSTLYNEFSSGRQDPTALRDFFRMIHKRNPKFKYALLIGDGSYDQRQITSGLSDTRFIPVYETDASLNPIFAFPTDDFFALLSDNEGYGLDGALDISIGRLPVKSIEEAEAVINKIIRYDIDPDRFGPWRTKIGYTADDEDGNTHFSQTDEIARNSFVQYPEINQQKIYFDAFKQEITPGGARYPAASEELNRNINSGQLVLSYLGHGGPGGWSQERVLKISDINSWNNIKTPTVIITATCSFSGYDDPSILTAGETAILQENGAAIALFTTVRAVYSSENKRLTENVFKQLLIREQGKTKTLGDIITIAKNFKQDTIGENSRKFTLIGDPSQKIAFPENNIVLTKINDEEISTFNDTINALEKVKIEGEIRNYNNQPLTDFNGILYTTVFDKASTLQTLANDPGSSVAKFTAYKNIIYKGQSSVNNGKFMVEFVVPADINYSIGMARISLYATDNATKDAIGYHNTLLIGGSGKNTVVDDQKPEIKVFMNDEAFVYGGITSSSPTILITAKDDTGINVTGTSIGHDLTAEIVGLKNEKYILNEYFEADLNDYRSGKARFRLGDLEPGKYTINAKVWDVANNSNTAKTEFLVVDSKNNTLQNVYNFPNPFTTNTKFTFEHDLEGQQCNVVINIYTMTGKIVKSIAQTTNFSGNRSFDMTWDGNDDFGQKLGKGVYFYKIKVYNYALGIVRESKFTNLVVL